MKVRLFYEGSIVVNVDANPENDEAWTEALGEAWANAPDEEVGAASDLTAHEIEQPVDDPTPQPMICLRCGGEGHGVQDCRNEWSS